MDLMSIADAARIATDVTGISAFEPEAGVLDELVVFYPDGADPHGMIPVIVSRVFGEVDGPASSADAGSGWWTGDDVRWVRWRD